MLTRTIAAFASVPFLVFGPAQAQPCPELLFGNQRHPVGVFPYELETGDFNADGVLDIAVPIESGRYIRVLIGDGDGTYTAATNITAGANPWEIQTADLDADGTDDFIVLDPTNNEVRVVLNRSFPSSRAYSVGEVPTQLIVRDLDNDGVPDIAVTNRINDELSVLLGTGDGLFADAVQYETLRLPEALAAADINLDGFLDLVVAGNGIDVQLFPNLGDGTFGPPTDYSLNGVAWEMHAADVNADSIEDLVIFSAAGVEVALGDGLGGFALSVEYQAQLSAGASGAIADLDADGDLDIAVPQRNQDNVLVLANAGNGTFEDAGTHEVGGEPNAVRVADINADKAPDLLVSNRATHDLHSLLGDGQLGFASGVQYEANFPTHVEAADFDGDGHTDMLVSGSTGDAAVYYNDGAGVFDESIGYNFCGQTESIAAGDLDGDGLNDLVVAVTQCDELAIVYSDPFAPKTTVAVERAPLDIALADIDGDGDTDILCVSGDENRAEVLFNDGSGDFPQRESYLVGDNPTSVVVADIDADGIPDFVTCDRQDDTLTVRFGAGDGSFLLRQTLPTGLNPWDVTVADLNADGLPDLAVACESGFACVHFNGGDRTFVAYAEYPAGDTPYSIVAGDINADGSLDLAVANYGSDDVSLLTNRGDGTFDPQLRFTAGEEPRSIAIADFDGNGGLDLAVAAHDGRELTVLENRCGPGSSCPADVNGDGVLTFFDLSLFLTGFADQTPLGDWDGDGRHTFFDMSAFFQAFSAGCGVG